MTMRKYRPTERDKEIVLRMAAIPNISRDNIAFCITNERTGRAIDRHTLEKNFAKELELATSNMQNLVMKSFIEMVAEKNWPAVKMGLLNYCGVKDDGGEVVANANVRVNVNSAEAKGIVVEFKHPSQKFDEDGNPIGTALPPPGAPRPIGQQEMYDEANLRYPHKLEHDSNPPPPPNTAAPDPARYMPPPPDPVPTPRTHKERKAALAERFEAEGLNGWSNVNPRSSYKNPNRIWDSKTRSYE
jgi:hypothetical protein